MANKKSVGGILVMILVFGLVLAGCDTGTDNTGTDNTGNDGDSKNVTIIINNSNSSGWTIEGIMIRNLLDSTAESVYLVGSASGNQAVTVNPGGTYNSGPLVIKKGGNAWNIQVRVRSVKGNSGSSKDWLYGDSMYGSATEPPSTITLTLNEGAGGTTTITAD